MAHRYFSFFEGGRKTFFLVRLQEKLMKGTVSLKGMSFEISQGMPRGEDVLSIA